LEAVFIRLDDIISQAITLGGGGNQDVDAAEQKMQDQKIDRFSLQKMHILLY
jgi:hypothetical protein